MASFGNVQPSDALRKGNQGLHARVRQVQAGGRIALRSADLLADVVAVETSMSTLLAAWSSSLWSRLFAPRLFAPRLFTSRLFAGASSLMAVGMASSLLRDSCRGYS
ncbi:hypothetical protein PF005_g17888 [Phytophthora fragariae]|uniref:Uncharacterized protein n=1 Tax=Phytophthora fragariae TaxID=53985 RepID=A0A6A3XNB0_9STRA|nr:hypothetical protein PF003_g28168 [Phytophthora fragariae]KAE8932514.1 hypothetical protein PF009_g17470 [Phytophthora fragariae]KAE9090948.1 hypothetical protein PF007_g19052 [Phytophthora fragariae]KAE9091312.1 hypothetical protein PF010_g18238 [Phytophthora fragariae]KAE9111714.1 hypothetical protein PF006_g20142 [Phytophthora fragariae]